MSRYRRSVHCRHCGESGHNINGCAKMKEYAKNNPNSWSAQKLKQREEAIQHRKCSYCGEEKHTRRTCTHIMSDMVKVAGINIPYRKKALETINRVGLGPGALISVYETSGYDEKRNYIYDKKDCLALVTDVDMNEIRALTDDRGCTAVQIQFMNLFDYNGTTPAKTNLHIPDWYLLGKDSPTITNSYWRDKLTFKIISPGHLVMENEDEWFKDKETIRRICEGHRDHGGLTYAINNYIKLNP